MTNGVTANGFAAAHPRGSVIAVTVVPRSARNQIEATVDGGLRARVTAPPVDGAANAAVLHLLADAIGVPQSRLEIISGASGRRKRILVRAFTPSDLAHSLRRISGTPG